MCHAPREAVQCDAPVGYYHVACPQEACRERFPKGVRSSIVPQGSTAMCIAPGRCLHSLKEA